MKGAVVIISVLVAIAMIQFMAKTGEAAVTCNQVDECLASCLPYLTKGGSPSATCCNGVKNLKAITPAVEDRQAACKCVKDVASKYQNINEDAAKSLPAKCDVQIDIPISKTTDCTNVK